MIHWVYCNCHAFVHLYISKSRIVSSSKYCRSALAFFMQVMLFAGRSRTGAEAQLDRIIRNSSPHHQFPLVPPAPPAGCRRMLRKTLPGVLRSPKRNFSSSAPSRLVVGTRSTRAQTVKVWSILLHIVHRREHLSSCLVVQSWESGKYPLIEHEYDAIVM